VLGLDKRTLSELVGSMTAHLSSPQEFRGTGKTTALMKAAPPDAVYIWCNSALEYPKQLAKKIGRADLRIVSPAWLSNRQWMGIELTGLVADHACRFSNDEWHGFTDGQTRVGR